MTLGAIVSHPSFDTSLTRPRCGRTKDETICIKNPSLRRKIRVIRARGDEARDYGKKHVKKIVVRTGNADNIVDGGNEENNIIEHGRLEPLEVVASGWKVRVVREPWHEMTPATKIRNSKALMRS